MVDKASTGDDSSACSRAPDYTAQTGLKLVEVLSTLTALCDTWPRSTVGVIGVFGAQALHVFAAGVDPTPQVTH